MFTYYFFKISVATLPAAAHGHDGAAILRNVRLLEQLKYSHRSSSSVLMGILGIAFVTGENAESFSAVLKSLVAPAVPVASVTIDPAMTRRNIELISRLSYGYTIPEIREREAMLTDAIVKLRVDYKIHQILKDSYHWFAGSKATYDFDSSASLKDQRVAYCGLFTIEPSTVYAEEVVTDFDRSCLCENVDTSLKRDIKEAIVQKVQEIQNNPEHKYYNYLNTNIDKEACGGFIRTTCTVTSGSQLIVPLGFDPLPDGDDLVFVSDSDVEVHVVDAKQ